MDLCQRNSGLLHFTNLRSRGDGPYFDKLYEESGGKPPLTRRWTWELLMPAIDRVQTSAHAEMDLFPS